MISTVFRVEMFLVAIFLLIYVIRSINKNKFSVKDTLWWFLLTIALVIFAIFPNFPQSLSTLLGFETTSNFLYFCALIYLLFYAISSNMKITKQEESIKILVQEVSLLKNKIKKEK